MLDIDGFAWHAASDSVPGKTVIIANRDVCIDWRGFRWPMIELPPDIAHPSPRAGKLAPTYANAGAQTWPAMMGIDD